MDRSLRARPILIFSLMALFLCFEMALQVSPGVMTTSLIQDMGVDAFGLGLMSSVYFYTYTLMQVPSGLLCDRTHMRNLVCFALLTCSLGAVFFSQAHGMMMGSLSRLLMGFGSAFAFLSVLTAADRFFHARHFAYLAGIAQLLAAIGGMAGNLPIAWLMDHWGWRYTILAFACLGLFLALLVWVTLSKFEEKRQSQRLTEPMKTSLSKILHNRQTWYLGLYVFLNWAPMTAFASLWGVPFLEATYGLSHQDAAMATSMMWLGVGLFAPVIGALSDFFGRRTVILAAMGLLGALSLAIVILAQRQFSLLTLCFLLFMAGGGSAGQIVTFAVIKDFTASVRISTSIGINNMAMVASGVVMQPFIGKLLSLGVGHPEEMLPSTREFQYALAILPIVFLLCALLSAFLIRETYATAPDEAESK